MKAVVVTMTKELAKDYLSRNNQNRKVNKKTLLFYKEQMLNNKWKENGEAIIIDVNGVIKDGQHRLIAVVETNHTYRVPVISGVEASVMDTIDTGYNRTASDVLHLEGFKYASLIASSVKLIIRGCVVARSAHESHISNSDILRYAKNNKSYLYQLIQSTHNVSSLQVARVMTDTHILFLLHKYGDTPTSSEFLQNILGVKRTPRTATDYVYKKLFKSYSGEERIILRDKQQYIEKAYDYFIKGNRQINRLQINQNKQKVN